MTAARGALGNRRKQRPKGQSRVEESPNERFIYRSLLQNVDRRIEKDKIHAAQLDSAWTDGRYDGLQMNPVKPVYQTRFT